MQPIAGKQWTRRQVLRSGASMAVLSQTPLTTLAAGSSGPACYAYVGVSDGLKHCIHVFSTYLGTWTEIQRISTEAPACLVLSATQKTLYVANDITEFQNLRRGSVESFCVDQHSGRLEFQSVQPLSLAATRPRSLAISPDGKLLAVASYDGGIYNLLPIADDGALERPVHIFKATGCGLHGQSQSSAHPHTLLFHNNSGHLLSSDYGSDQLDTFVVRGDKLERNMRHATCAARGPGAIALHPNGHDLFVWNELAGALTVHRFDDATGAIGPYKQLISTGTVAADRRLRGSICVHPSGKTFYSSCQLEDALTVWNADIASGMLSGRTSVPLRNTRPIQIVAAADGTSVFVVDGQRGSIVQIGTHPGTGRALSCRQVAAIRGARCLVLHAA